jgi:hypothetical protein
VPIKKKRRVMVNYSITIHQWWHPPHVFISVRTEKLGIVFFAGVSAAQEFSIIQLGFDTCHYILD